MSDIDADFDALLNDGALLNDDVGVSASGVPARPAA